MFEVHEVLKATGGRLLAAGPETFSGISTDSRTIKEGELFVPLVGDKFDGHDFIAQVFEKGASGALVAAGRAVPAPGGKAVIEVKDTLRALQDIAHHLRTARPGLKVVGVTGTNGKTTTKEMLASILAVRGPVLKNEGNLNNGIGVPLTLLRLKDEHWAAVIEMGMNSFGEIQRLAEIAAPQVGVVTNIGPGHLENLGSLEGVAKAKGELVAALPEGGTAVLNADDPYLRDGNVAARCGTVMFGLGKGADLSAAEVEETPAGVVFSLVTRGGAVRVKLPVLGFHNVYDALAAASAASALGLSLPEIKEGLEGFRPAKMRMEVVDIDGAKVINDAYNANPSSMAAALNALAGIKDARRIAVLGDMKELGESAEKAHYDVGRLAGAGGLACLILVGEQARHMAYGAAEAGMDEKKIIQASSPEDAGAKLAERLSPGDCVLVKGSRSMKMERVVEFLKSRKLVA